MSNTSILLLLYVAIVSAVTIHNDIPRLDNAGRIVNAHDGNILHHKGMFYMYGTVYGDCHQKTPTCDGVCGYRPNVFSLYISGDMNNWQLVSTDILPAMKQDNAQIPYWMPNVYYNEKTTKWVMVYWDNKYGFANNKIAIATSDSPVGPFTPQTPLVMSGAQVVSSTVAFYVDRDTGKGYIRYNTMDSPRRHVLEELESDWMTSTKRFVDVYVKPGYPWYEGGGMFKNRQNGLYYILLGSDCCFCQWGSDAIIFVAKDPMGNWTQQEENINWCADGKTPDWTKASGQDVNQCSIGNPLGTNFTIPAQPFAVVEVQGAKEWKYLYYGERSRSAPDGLKAHNFQAWIPFEFDGPKVKKMSWLNSFELEL